MSKTQWMVLLMVAAIGMVGCSKTDEETAKDLEAAEKAAEAPKKVEATDVAKPMLKDMTKAVENNEAVASAVAAVAPSDSQDKVAKDKLALMTSLIGILEGVTDKATAEKAKPELEALVKKAAALKALEKKLGEPTAEEKEGLTEKYGPQMEAGLGKLGAQIGRLSEKPEAMAVLQKSMMEILRK